MLKTFMTKILIVEARFYDKISDLLLKGAKAALDEDEITYDIVTVPGALEIPAVIKFAKDKYDGFVALGCVIRGETYHFEVVSNMSAQGILDLSIGYDLAIGNGILTVENEAQAIIRAKKWDKGAHAVNACLELVKLKESLATRFPLLKGSDGR
jgi:6,7-dimethyl-8-ribityllumazine synthase